MGKTVDKRLVACIMIFFILLGLVGCRGEQEEQETHGGTVFVDDYGREVEVPDRLNAVIPAGPVAQMMLYAIAPELIAGLASRYSETAVGIIPEDHLKLPYFGQLYRSAELSVEELAAAELQLIVDIGQPSDGGMDDMVELQKVTQIPSVFLSVSLETMPAAFRKLGILLDREERGEELARFCETVYNRAISIMEQVGEHKVTALYITGEDGLNVLAKGSYHAEIIDLMTENLAVLDVPSGKGTGNEVTLEQIALWDPEFILFSSGSVYDTAAETAVWRELTAIAGGNYVEVPEGPHNWVGMPPAVQRCLALIWLPAELYPQYCDYNAMDEIMTFYRLFYHCELTESQYNALTANAIRR